MVYSASNFLATKHLGRHVQVAFESLRKMFSSLKKADLHTEFRMVNESKGIWSLVYGVEP